MPDNAFTVRMLISKSCSGTAPMGEGIRYAFYFLIESEFQRRCAVSELSKKSKVYRIRDANIMSVRLINR